MNDLEWLWLKCYRKINNNLHLLEEGWPVNCGFPIPLTDEQLKSLIDRFDRNGYTATIEEEKQLNDIILKYLKVTKKK